MINVKVADLTPHPINREIYTDNEIDDLVQSIGKYGMRHPITITKDNVILSGHRRVMAHKVLQIEEIPAEVIALESREDEIVFLITENQYREKNREEKIREGIIIEETEKVLAKDRQDQARKKNGDVKFYMTGPVRDIVGRQIGMSGVNYAKGKKVVGEIDKLRKSGQKAKAIKVEKALNDGSIMKAEKVLEGAPQPKSKQPLHASNYWPELEKAIAMMMRAYKKLSRTRNHTTPEAYGHMIGNLKEMADRLSTWNPRSLVACPQCDGKGTKEGIECKFCFGGKVGMSKKSEF